MTRYADLATLRRNISPDVVIVDDGRPAVPHIAAAEVDAATLALEANAGALGDAVPLEHDEQAELFEWARDNKALHPELEMLYANVNGGKLPYHRNAKGQVTSPQRIKLVQEGLKRGVPDVTLAVPRGRFHALYIELKRADHSNKPTPEQIEWIDNLRRYGYEAVVAYGAQEAQTAIMAYLGQEG